MEVQIRWLIRRDMPEVLAIEKLCFDFPWVDEDFMCCLRQRNCIGMVATDSDNTISGFMVYELHKNRLHILNFAVHPEWRRSGVGRQMIDRLKDKIHQQRRREILTEVRETNLVAQQFFREMRFRAITVLRDHYEDTDEDAYIMRFRLEQEDDSDGTHTLRNRISEFVNA